MENENITIEFLINQSRQLYETCVIRIGQHLFSKLPSEEQALFKPATKALMPSGRGWDSDGKEIYKDPALILAEHPPIEWEILFYEKDGFRIEVDLRESIFTEIFKENK